MFDDPTGGRLRIVRKDFLSLNADPVRSGVVPTPLIGSLQYRRQTANNRREDDFAPNLSNVWRGVDKDF